jgi:hypothetical protein
MANTSNLIPEVGGYACSRFESGVLKDILGGGTVCHEKYGQAWDSLNEFHRIFGQGLNEAM